MTDRHEATTPDTLGQSYAPCIGLDDCPPATFAPSPRKETRRTRRPARVEPGNRRIRKACRAADATVGIPLGVETLRVFVSRAFGPCDAPAPWRVTREIRAHVVSRDGEPVETAAPAPEAPEGDALPEGWAEAIAGAHARDVAEGLAPGNVGEALAMLDARGDA